MLCRRGAAHRGQQVRDGLGAGVRCGAVRSAPQCAPLRSRPAAPRRARPTAPRPSGAAEFIAAPAVTSAPPQPIAARAAPPRAHLAPPQVPTPVRPRPHACPRRARAPGGPPRGAAPRCPLLVPRLLAAPWWPHGGPAPPRGGPTPTRAPCRGVALCFPPPRAPSPVPVPDTHGCHTPRTLPASGCPHTPLPHSCSTPPGGPHTPPVCSPSWAVPRPSGTRRVPTVLSKTLSSAGHGGLALPRAPTRPVMLCARVAPGPSALPAPSPAPQPYNRGIWGHI